MPYANFPAVVKHISLMLGCTLFTPLHGAQPNSSQCSQADLGRLLSITSTGCYYFEDGGGAEEQIFQEPGISPTAFA